MRIRHPEIHRVKQEVHSFQSLLDDAPDRKIFRKLHAISMTLNLMLLADGVTLLLIGASEVPREVEMSLFRRMPYELDSLNLSGSNSGEVATALKVALLRNNTKPYRLEQIMSLRKVLELVKKDMSVGSGP